MNNSNTVGELFKDKFIKMDVLDTAVLQQLIDTLEKDTAELESLTTRNAALSYLQKTPITDNVKTVTELMDILNR
jgi:hypothetical protein